MSEAPVHCDPTNRIPRRFDHSGKGVSLQPYTGLPTAPAISIQTMHNGSDIEDDSISSALSTNKQGARTLLTIPAKLIFDEMLFQLSFPPAEYRERVYEDYKTRVTVIFHTSRLPSVGPMAISGVRSVDAAVAEHTAAEEAIRYLETATNTVIKDLNYSRLQRSQEENRYLKSQLRKEGVKSQMLARGWFLAVRFMNSFADQFHNLAILSTFGGQEVISDAMKAAFANIEGIAQRLRSRSNRLETKLEEVRKRS